MNHTLYARLKARQYRAEARRVRQGRGVVARVQSNGLTAVRPAGMVAGILYRITQHPSGALIIRHEQNQTGWTRRADVKGRLALPFPPHTHVTITRLSDTEFTVTPCPDTVPNR